MRSVFPMAMLLLVALTAGCGSESDAGTPYGVTSTVVSHETTQEVAVFAPEADGSWPVVYALHGLGGSWQDWAESATALASQGVVVFAPNGRTTEAVEQGRWADLQQDTECAYRFVHTIAADYGGDLGQPISVAGHSLGATGALDVGLNEAAYGPDGSYDVCFSGTPRPEVIVPIAGCHYEYQGNRFGFSTTGFTNQAARVVLVAGEDDEICEAWQSQDARTVLEEAGYDVELVKIADANHFTVIFHDLVDGEWLAVPNDPAGREVVRSILDAIAAAQQG
ncbi:MAG: alpha/beta hydrolase-fold protein [Acidimicrobiia bacterium]|nr:alpha/beta hydrolase-fold protein [Acidimicrobiia bacterium]